MGVFIPILCRFFHPFKCFVCILLHGLSIMVACRYHVHGPCVAGLGSLLVEPHCFVLVFLHAVAVLITQAQASLCLRVLWSGCHERLHCRFAAIAGCLCVNLVSLCLVCLHADALLVAGGQVVQPCSVVLCCGLCKPSDGLSLVFLYASPLVVAYAKAALCGGQTPFGCLAIPFHGFCHVLFHTVAVLIHLSQQCLRHSHALLGQLAEQFGRLGMVRGFAVAAFVVVPSLIVQLLQVIFLHCRGWTGVGRQEPLCGL